MVISFSVSLFLFKILEELKASQCFLPILDLESVPYSGTSTVLATWLISNAVTNVCRIKVCEFRHDLQCQLSGTGTCFSTLSAFVISFILVEEEKYFELIRWLLLSNHVEVKLRIIVVIQPEVRVGIWLPLRSIILMVLSIVVVVSITISVLVPSVVVPGSPVLVVRPVTPAVVLSIIIPPFRVVIWPALWLCSLFLILLLDF